MSSSYLFKIQIGPVQDFVAQARSTRDLWSGSYLLSWLMGTAIHHAISDHNAHLVYPDPEEQPILKFHQKGAFDRESLRIANLPNLFVARITTDDPEALAAAIEGRIKDEWEEITKAVWKEAVKGQLVQEEKHTQFKHQAAHFLFVAWQITPEQSANPAQSGYDNAYRRNDWLLDAVRRTRNFQAWGDGGWKVERLSNKDSLSGKEEAITGGPGWAQTVTGKYRKRFRHDDWIGAITLIKRLWDLAYPWDEKGLFDFRFPSTLGIAMHKPESDDDGDEVDAEQGERYFAVLSLDGDGIGKLVSGDWLPKGVNLEEFHTEFSRCLSDFALKHVRSIVENRFGRVIYAGGDDVVALLPADTAIPCALELRKAFRNATGSILKKYGKQPEVSVGIAIAHFKSPLQDVVRAGKQAEKRAKNALGRAALAVTLLKRSGEHIEWGAKWDSGGLDVFETVSNAIRDGTLSGKFPHRVAELVRNYWVDAKSIAAGAAAPVSEFAVIEIMRREFEFALLRQYAGSDSERQTLLDTASAQLASYLKKVEALAAKRLSSAKDNAPTWSNLRLAERRRLELAPVNDTVEAVLGLCSTAAFVLRETPDEVGAINR